MAGRIRSIQKLSLARLVSTSCRQTTRFGNQTGEGELLDWTYTIGHKRPNLSWLFDYNNWIIHLGLHCYIPFVTSGHRRMIHLFHQVATQNVNRLLINKGFRKHCWLHDNRLGDSNRLTTWSFSCLFSRVIKRALLYTYWDLHTEKPQSKFSFANRCKPIKCRVSLFSYVITSNQEPRIMFFHVWAVRQVEVFIHTGRCFAKLKRFSQL